MARIYEIVHEKQKCRKEPISFAKHLVRAKARCQKPVPAMSAEVMTIEEIKRLMGDTGRRPGNKRGIKRRAAYEREKLMDPVRMQAFVSRSTAGSPCNLTQWQRFQLEDALSSLTERERECYVLTHGEGFSFDETARL
ncbi:sigma factor-like helix-turn-helix DNA-binding protein [Brevibacillus sp. FIR094]|uniref:sigma factor-like helix-turn-helix DNA-binding protein n=1 Tax=Brevibacillus sp. FIR094 TaxID=3134809 RepID=UPI003D1A7D96